MTLNEAYNDVVKRIDAASSLSMRDKRNLMTGMETLDLAIKTHEKHIDKTNLEECLRAVSNLNPIKPHHFKDTYVPCMRDLFTIKRIALLFGMTESAVQSRINYYMKTRTTMTGGELDGVIDPEEISRMSPDDFTQKSLKQARLIYMKSLMSANVTQQGLEVAKRIIDADTDRKIKDVEAMWKLGKEWMEFLTGDCLPKLMKKIKHTRPPFDERVLMAEVMDEKYKELQAKYEAVRPREYITPIDALVKKVQRRGKSKLTRKVLEKEEKQLKASSSFVENVAENVGSPSPSVSEPENRESANLDQK